MKAPKRAPRHSIVVCRPRHELALPERDGPMIAVEHVTKSFGPMWVLKDVSFVLDEGAIVGLVGPSGAGKSVLLKIMGRVLPPTSGAVHHGEGPEAELDSSSIGFLFQEGALFDSQSVLENVAFPLRNLPRAVRPSWREADERAYAMLEEVGLQKAYQKHPGQLSGGMRRRVALARALVARPELVLLDDPTGGLDPVAAAVIMDLIAELHSKFHPTVVLVSHDIRRLLPRVRRVLALFDGKIVSDTAPGDIVSQAPPEVVQFLKTRFDFENTKGLFCGSAAPGGASKGSSAGKGTPSENVSQ